MTVADALYEPEGDAFIGTDATTGAWGDGGQGGGAVLALLGHVLEDVPMLTPMSLSRLTVDIIKPVPVGVPLHVETDILREGKRIQLVELTVHTPDSVTTRARALRIRDMDLTGMEGIPASTSEVNPSEALPPPERLYGVDHIEGVANFLRFGIELRRSVEPIDGVHGIWCRLRLPVVAGEEVRNTSRAVLPLDVVNMIGVRLDPAVVTSINPDVSGHISRAPIGDWVALSGHTHYDHGVGHGVSMAVMSDEAGVFGTTSTSQILQPMR
jgi:hypothetical protein